MILQKNEQTTPAAYFEELIAFEYPPVADGVVYLNSGSCGRKPKSVLQAINDGWQKLNVNPTYTTFVDLEPAQQARKAAADLFSCDPQSLLLTANTSAGLQLIMQSFLLEPGDELVISDHEHGITRTICQYLEKTRGIVVRTHPVDPFAGSKALCQGLLELVNKRTRLVEVSEIDCFTGWRPDLTLLDDSLREARIPLLVDGAHVPGQGPCNPGKYPLWVGSGHKWLGGPNGTGFAYVSPELVPKLEPILLGDHFYDFDNHQLLRFEAQGTTDVVRLMGLTAAAQLFMKLDAVAVAEKQRALVQYLRCRLTDLPRCSMRTPELIAESTGMVAFYWPPEQVSVEDLRDALWQKHQIWIQPDFISPNPGAGMRISCHISTSESDIDKLIEALAVLIKR